MRSAEIEEFLDAPLKTLLLRHGRAPGVLDRRHSDPDVLLVDEVLAVGDEAFSHRCLEKFAEFERAGKTILVVSHDLALVSQRCRRAIWLDRGRLQADGPADETVALYRERVAVEEGGRREKRSALSSQLSAPNARLWNGRRGSDPGW